MINSQNQEIELLHVQLTGQATGLTDLRFVFAEAPATEPSYLAYAPDTGRSCRLSEWMRWLNTASIPAAVATSCSREMIQSPCAIA